MGPIIWAARAGQSGQTVELGGGARPTGRRRQPINNLAPRALPAGRQLIGTRLELHLQPIARPPSCSVQRGHKCWLAGWLETVLHLRLLAAEQRPLFGCPTWAEINKCTSELHTRRSGGPRAHIICTPVQRARSSGPSGAARRKTSLRAGPKRPPSLQPASGRHGRAAPSCTCTGAPLPGEP